MVMEIQDAALGLAGVLGSGTAVVHGILTQRLMVKPIDAFLSGNQRVSAPIRRLVPLLLHLSTISWFLGGLALLPAALWWGYDTKLAIGLSVGSLYLFGAVVNAWATRARHAGWMLMAAAVLLIVVGLAHSTPLTGVERC
jgi:hypothetical protein